MATYWTPLGCLSGMREGGAACNGEKVKFALVVVNMPLDGMVDKFKTLWDAASVKASTDGGSNRLHNMGLVEDDVNRYVPDFISGDLDSITDDVLKYYQEKGVEVIPTPDQDETDLTKCLRILFSRAQSTHEFDYVVVLNAFGKRLDQTMANIDTLFHAMKITEKPVFLLSEDSLGCLLSPGKHVIEVNTGLEHKWCGLIPIGAKCTQITTTGLKWNLTDGQLEFGSLISTSNTYDGSDTVTIETNTTILWTMGVK